MSEEFRARSEEVRGRREEVSPLFPPRSSLKPPRSSLYPPRSNLLAPTSSLLALSALDLPRIGATPHRGGFRNAASAAVREAGDCRRGEGDGAFAQAGGEGALHEGGERSLLREILRRAPHLSRQAGRIRRNHPRRAQGVGTMKMQMPLACRARKMFW